MSMNHKKIISSVAVFAALVLFVATGCSLPGNSLPASSQELSLTSSFEQSSALGTPSAASALSEETSSSPIKASAATTSKNNGAAERDGIADTVDMIADSIVAINVTGVAYDYFNRSYPTEGSGSGIIVSSDGYIITNNHVVTGGTKITVFLKDGRSFTAELIGKSITDDIALLKINATGLTIAKIGDSSTLRIGDYTIVIGNPLGELQGTVTTGIISALEREIELDGTVFTVLQTDAAVNLGNSGGGMFDSNGDLIGMVIAKTSVTGVEGLGFVLPINGIVPIINELRENGYVTGRPYIGLYSLDINSYFTARMYNVDYTGVYVQAVDDGSPAALAGLRNLDLIQKIDGISITKAKEVTDIIQSKKVGDKVTFEIYRQGNYSGTGENLGITVTVGENKG